jgi:deazaflavin-dependent oxidoreductase (nitroreductase family)
VIRLFARPINPLTLTIAGRRWMPIVGILRHRGRKSGRVYSTPLGMRPFGDAFVMPRTFGSNAAWYRNVLAAGWCVLTYRGRDYTLVEPEVVDYATAAPAFPRYERLQFRLIGINEFLRMRQAPADFLAADLERAGRGSIGLAVLGTVAANVTKSRLANVRPSHEAISQAITTGFTTAFEVGALISLAGFVLAILVIHARSQRPAAAGRREAA